MIALALIVLAVGYPHPSFTGESHAHANGNITFAGTFDLDPHDWCVPYDYTEDPNLEPDLGPEGDDSCGTPQSLVTVVVRVDGKRVRTFYAKAQDRRGSWRLTIPCRGRRWSATLESPWRARLDATVSGRTRCQA